MNVTSARRVPERRHAADREARVLAHERGIGAADRLAEQRGELRLVDAIRAARQHQHAAPGARGAKDRAT